LNKQNYVTQSLYPSSREKEKRGHLATVKLKAAKMLKKKKKRKEGAAHPKGLLSRQYGSCRFVKAVATNNISE